VKTIFKKPVSSAGSVAGTGGATGTKSGAGYGGSSATGAGGRLRDFHGNAKACLLFLPLWSIPYSLSFFYLSLYLRASGVSDGQLGILVTAGAASSILFSLLSAPIVDAIGRKKSVLIFDLTGSVLPFLIYAISGSFMFAMAGTLVANSGKIMNVGYSLLMTEDADNKERASSFNVFNILMIASGILVPIAGRLVERLGVVSAERWFLAVSALAMTGSAFGRNHFVTETGTGRGLIEKHRADTRKSPFAPGSLNKPYRRALSYLGNNKAAAAAVSANILFYVYYIVGTNNSLYFAPFFADAFGMTPSMVSFVGAAFSAGTLCAMLFLNPMLFRRMEPASCALVGAAITLAGFFPLVFIARGGIAPAIVFVLLSSIGYGILKTGVDAALATCFGDAPAGAEARAGVYSVANLVSSLLGMGAGALCGLFYPQAPRSIPLISILILAAICASLIYARTAAYQSGRSRRTS
jgi:Na+/melibiose symporter-like transporter